MIEAKMPKDIRQYKTKLIGPFTGRQAACVAIMIAVDLILYSTVAAPLKLSMNMMIYGLLIVDIPIALFGWYEPHEVPLEKYIKNIWLRTFTAPRKRLPKRILYAPVRRKPKNNKKSGKVSFE